MKDADHIDQSGIHDAEKQDMGADGQFPVAGADIVSVAPLPAPVGQCLAAVRMPRM
ncbi:MAG TPA: hypothetical protein VK943_16860 [Arenibaculum sp.]|nr:hypothetical protein [Arenibaculum sp.]